jgi:hypothetical protein
MGKIEQTLMKIRDEIKLLLLEIYPNMVESISFHWEEGYQEWFGMLFQLNAWELRSGMIDINDIQMSESRTEEVRKEMTAECFKNIEDYGFISVVEMDNKFHLIDGYHRVLIAKDIGISQLRGCVWKKEYNNHKNCEKIKLLIINNL